MGFDRKYLLPGLFCLILGICLGMYLGVSQDHGEQPTHAHINLAGFALLLVYGIIPKLWLGQPKPMPARFSASLQSPYGLAHC